MKFSAVLAGFPLLLCIGSSAAFKLTSVKALHRSCPLLSKPEVKPSAFDRIDTNTGDFIDKYVWSITDTRPYGPQTTIGTIFLTTNVGFLIASIFFYHIQNPYATSIAIMSDVAGVASFIYHYRQLELGPDKRVRTFLAIDYVVAITTIVISLPYFYRIASEYMGSYDKEIIASLIFGVISIVCFLIGAVSSGLQYVVFHGLWHIFSATAASLIGAVASATTTT